MKTKLYQHLPTLNPKLLFPPSPDTFHHIGEPDEELTEGDVTRLSYNISDGRTGYLCFIKRGTDTIIDCSYTYDPAEKKITYFMKVSDDCNPEPYYEYHKNE